jgi:hypothetical protein
VRCLHMQSLLWGQPLLHCNRCQQLQLQSTTAAAAAVTSGLHLGWKILHFRWTAELHYVRKFNLATPSSENKATLLYFFNRNIVCTRKKTSNMIYIYHNTVWNWIMNFYMPCDSLWILNKNNNKGAEDLFSLGNVHVKRKTVLITATESTWFSSWFWIKFSCRLV